MLATGVPAPDERCSPLNQCVLVSPLLFSKRINNRGKIGLRFYFEVVLYRNKL